MARLWGKDPGKTGGRDRPPPAYEHQDHGPRTCGACGGVGETETEKIAEDEGETYTEYVRGQCAVCMGKGVV